MTDQTNWPATPGTDTPAASDALPSFKPVMSRRARMAALNAQGDAGATAVPPVVAPGPVVAPAPVAAPAPVVAAASVVAPAPVLPAVPLAPSAPVASSAPAPVIAPVVSTETFTFAPARPVATPAAARPVAAPAPIAATVPAARSARVMPSAPAPAAAPIATGAPARRPIPWQPIPDPMAPKPQAASFDSVIGRETGGPAVPYPATSAPPGQSMHWVSPAHGPVQPQWVSPTAASDFGAEYARPPKKRSPWLWILVTLGLFALVGIVGVTVFGGARDWLDRTFSVAEVPDYPGPGDEPVLVTIPSGASGTMMGELLYEAGVVASPEAFRNAFRDNPRASSIQAGTYELQLHMSAAQAVQAMLDNGTITFRLVIPEGFTKDQVFARITAVTGITQEEIDAALADPEALGLPEVAQGNPEGWLFPATYQIQPGQDATSILRTLIARTRQELTTQGADPDQWEVILNKAALVEREVRDPADRPKVARAIQNRLDRDMALQIDAAVAYGLGISGTQLTTAMLQDASNQFNTYQHTGLPPTPIANPGAAAIAAVLNPAEGNWIFWVTVNLATGETIFTDTYADHQRYVAQLREWQAANPGFGQSSDTGANQTD